MGASISFSISPASGRDPSKAPSPSSGKISTFESLSLEMRRMVYSQTGMLSAPIHITSQPYNMNPSKRWELRRARDTWCWNGANLNHEPEELSSGLNTFANLSRVNKAIAAEVHDFFFITAEFKMELSFSRATIALKNDDSMSGTTASLLCPQMLKNIRRLTLIVPRLIIVPEDGQWADRRAKQKLPEYQPEASFLAMSTMIVSPTRKTTTGPWTIIANPVEAGLDRPGADCATYH